MHLALASAALSVAAAGTARVALAVEHPPVPAASQADRAPHPLRHLGARAQSFGMTLPAAVPTSLAIPSLDVSVDRLSSLGLASDGSVQAPPSFDVPGWFRSGPTPGQLGTAVVVGHVDSRTGPAVFWRLAELRRGDRIRVGRGDGSMLTFSVYAVEQFPKDRFPATRVYANVANGAELRLITCGGAFDAAVGHYRDNVVVFSRLVAVHS